MNRAPIANSIRITNNENANANSMACGSKDSFISSLSTISRRKICHVIHANGTPRTAPAAQEATDIRARS